MTTEVEMKGHGDDDHGKLVEVSLNGETVKVIKGKYTLPELKDALGVDPRLFRAFNVTRVPQIVAVSSDFDLCDGFHCTTQLPPHDRMMGNVTLRYALETFAQGHGPGAPVAAHALQALRHGG